MDASHERDWMAAVILATVRKLTPGAMVVIVGEGSSERGVVVLFGVVEVQTGVMRERDRIVSRRLVAAGLVRLELA